SAYDKNQSIQKSSTVTPLSQRVPAGKIITIFSTKGGVGKSTIAVNLAVTLAMFLKDSGRRVALLDGNFQFGDIGFMLNLKPERTIHGLVREMGEPAPLTFELLKSFMTTHPTGLDVMLAPSKPQFAEEVTMLHLGYVMECLKKNYDYVVVDTIHHINDTDLTIFDWTSMLFVIATLEVTTIKNLVLTLEILKDLQIPKDKISLILNRAYQKMGVECSTVEEKLMKISCMIPSDGERVVASLNSGNPFVIDLKADIPIVKSFHELAEFVVTDEDRSYFSKMEEVVQPKGNVLDFFKNLIKK
ncbi:MAG TPA: P-loop NTPase, partial [Candidatus Wallbacteria bacterium]|nr:P-loop NTPase [Candidatus Wallbacteria bacterium]